MRTIVKNHNAKFFKCVELTRYPLDILLNKTEPVVKMSIDISLARQTEPKIEFSNNKVEIE